jgi:hypothetical protein
MKRRDLLGTLALGVAGLAGCGSSDGERAPTPNAPDDGSETPEGVPPDASIPVYPFNAGSATEFEFEEGEDGTVIIQVPVENTKEEPYAGTLSLTVSVGDEKRTVSREIQLDGGASAKFPVEVDANYSEWTPNFQNVEFSQGTPTGE